MSEKKLVNPVTVIRSPEAINKEYSELVVRLGSVRVEVEAITDAYEKQETRKEEIEKFSIATLKRIKELSIEMQEANAEIQRKAKEATTEVAPVVEVVS